MASKKKRGRKPATTKRSKPKAGARKAKAGAAKTKAAAGKAKAAAGKAKAAAGKAKAAAGKAKAAAGKAKAAAPKAQRPKARKRAPVTVTKAGSRKAAGTKKQARRTADAGATEPSTGRSGPIVLDEVLEVSLVDVSTILRVKDGVARSQRDVDEDERRQFSDPSLVVEAQTRDPRREDDDTDESADHLPDLFAAEARLQKARVADGAGGAQTRHDGSLFGSLGSRTPKEDVDVEIDIDVDVESEDQDED